MTDVSAMEFDRTEATQGFVTTHGKGLVIGVVLLALLPFPMTMLRVLPIYDLHARFLVFYAPLICFLTVGYFFYVRDVLARLLFKHLLEPPPERDPYYPPTLSVLARRGATKVRVAVLGLVPIVLAAGSFYCVIAYIDRLQDSVAVVSRVMLARMPAQERTQFLIPGVVPATAAAPEDSAPGPSVPPAAAARARDTGASRIDQTALRLYTLRAADIEDIAFFRELTMLYIGAFVCAIGAAMMMILKEHARDVLGLSEESLLLGVEPEPAE